MKKQVERRTCDKCGAVEEQSEMTIGGSPFTGWFQLSRTDGSTVYPRKDNGPWDFCRRECLMDFVKSFFEG